jgi:biopolymer transport protein ExbD/phage FluMu protein Com
MTIKFACPKCGKQLAAAESLAGRQRKCPNCRTPVDVPTAEDRALATATSVDQPAPPADHPLLLFPARGARHENLIDMTAMVEIVFFLLIFFLVTSMQSLEAVIDLPAPQAPDSAATSVHTVPDYANDPNYVVVTIDADDAVWVEDEEALSEQDLRAKLRAARQEDERDGMLVKGSGDATHGKFVMVLDAGADAGMNELLFSVEESEDTADGG